MRKLTWRTKVIALVGVLCLPVGLSAAINSGAGQQTQEVTEQITVRAMNIEAVVMDKDGVRVPGLTKDNFRLYVDDELVDVDFFTEVREGAIIGGDTTHPAVAAEQRMGANILIFIDEFFAMPNDKKRVLNALKDRVQNLAPEDQIAIIAWNGEGIELLTGWTSAHDEINAAMDVALDRDALGLRRRQERSTWDIWDSPGPEGAEPWRNQRESWGSGNPGRNSSDMWYLDGQERQYAHLYLSQLRGAVGATVAAMRGVPVPGGRNVLLLASGGWPFDPAQYVGGSENRMIHEPGIVGGTELYGPLANTANLLGYTIYGVDMPGMQTSMAATSPGEAPNQRSQFFLEGEVHNTMHFVAVETGGLALINAQRVTALGEASADLDNYYWVSFTPDWQGDDNRHSIRIETTDPELLIRHRQGYYDMSPQQAVMLSVQGSMLFRDRDTMDDFDVVLGAIEREGRNEINVPVQIALDGGDLSAISSDGQFMIKGVLFYASMDEDGAVSAVKAVTISFQSGTPPAAGQIIRYDFTATLQRKEQRLALAFYDIAGDNTLATIVPINP
jgi:VWFA-related protein